MTARARPAILPADPGRPAIPLRQEPAPAQDRQLTDSRSSAGAATAPPKTGTTPATAGPWLLDDARNRGVLDGVRALGIVLVVAFHGVFVFVKVLERPQLEEFIAGLPPVFNIVWQALGSEIVFFTTGFLLSYLLLREHARHGWIDVRHFWLRRAARIVPLFLVALALFMLGRHFYWDRLLTNLLFSSRAVGYFELTPHGGKNYIPVGWSLEVLVHAYVLLPFLVLGVLRTRWPLCAALALAALSVVPRHLALEANPAALDARPCDILDVDEIPEVLRDLYYLTWFRLTPFLIGLAAAVVATRHRAALERWFASPLRATATLAAGAALFVASGFLPLQDRTSFVYETFGPREWHWFWTAQRAVLIAGLALVVLAALAARRGPAALLARFLALRTFAPISHGIYSIYLFHFACLVPAALLVFLPTVVTTLAESPSWDRKVLLEQLSRNIGSASTWQYVVMVVVAVWLSTRLATFLTRVLETPLQNRLRARLQRRTRPGEGTATPQQATGAR